jgi:penicillin-binding protein 1C
VWCAGGSTLTMQVARILDMPTRRHARTPWRKLRQLARAIQLEVHLSKREILTIYLNRAAVRRHAGRRRGGELGLSLRASRQRGFRTRRPHCSPCSRSRQAACGPDREPERRSRCTRTRCWRAWRSKVSGRRRKSVTLEWNLVVARLRCSRRNTPRCFAQRLARYASDSARESSPPSTSTCSERSRNAFRPTSPTCRERTSAALLVVDKRHAGSAAYVRFGRVRRQGATGPCRHGQGVAFTTGRR